MQNLELRNIYQNIKNIAIIGISADEGKISNSIGKKLKDRLYKIIPINPNYNEVLGEKAYKSITEVKEEIDLALFFINSDKVFPFIKEAIAKNVGNIWLQEGIISETGEKEANMAKIPFMMDKCIYKELKKIENENK